MDISDINKTANRKRLTEDAEKLRDKVSHETAKIIKLKVAQDTAYWDLNEKLHQLENNHEKLQQNMLDVQMQYETISGQYQDELRLRPETMNKVLSTRKICDVLEDYSEKLKETLSRCKLDQATLCDAYQKSAQFLNDTKVKQLQQDETCQRVIASLEEKVKLTSDHQNQMFHFFNVAKSQADSELNDTKTKLSAAQGKNEELYSAVNELNISLNNCRHDLEKKNESLTSLQNDIKQLLNEFSSQSADMKRTLEKKNMDLKESSEANESLTKALSNQEEFAKSVCEQNNLLQEKISTLEEEQLTTINAVKDLETRLENATLTNKDLNRDLEKITEEKEDLLKTVADKNQLITNLESQLVASKARELMLEADKLEITSEFNKTKDERDDKAVTIENLMTSGRELENTIGKLKETVEDIRVEKENIIKGLKITIESKDKELDLKASTINQLMCEVKAATDICYKMENDLENLKKQMEGERESGKERERKLVKQVERLEVVVKGKEDELSKQMSIILETRNEKDRLQEKIFQMQVTIDNIQKELSGPMVQPPRERPEQDDNAVMIVMSTKEMFPSPPKLQKTSEFAVPRAEPRAEPRDQIVCKFFSDSSNDGNLIDQAEVDRRFEALVRGEPLSPKPLSQLLKRRDRMPASQGRRQINNADDQLCVSQVNNSMKNKERHFFKNKRSKRKE